MTSSASARRKNTDRQHALTYHGPFEVNFERQRPGDTAYVKRDGTTAAYLGPRYVPGIRFCGMEKVRPREGVITRLIADGADVCLHTPVPARDTGPSGSWLSDADALAFLTGAIEANPELRDELRPFVRFFG